MSVTVEEFEAMLARSVEFLHQGLTQRAVDALTALVQVAPGDARVYRMLGLACHRLRSYGVAYLVYGVAVDLNPDDVMSEALRAECGMFVLPAEESRAALRAAAQRVTSDPEQEVYLQRARLLLSRVEMANKKRTAP